MQSIFSFVILKDMHFFFIANCLKLWFILVNELTMGTSCYAILQKYTSFVEVVKIVVNLYGSYDIF